MKKLFCLLAVIVLVSCTSNDYVIQEEAREEYQRIEESKVYDNYRYKVVEIVPISSSFTVGGDPYYRLRVTKGYCKFRLESPIGLNGVFDELDYYAKCNEFQIGDEVFLKAVKEVQPKED